jgi:hypothetical protein
LDYVVRPTAQNVCSARIIILRSGGRIPYKQYFFFIFVYFVLLSRLAWQMPFLGKTTV